MVTHQLQVERRTGKVRRPETDVLPLCHATNLKLSSSNCIQTLVLQLRGANAHALYGGAHVTGHVYFRYDLDVQFGRAPQDVAVVGSRVVATGDIPGIARSRAEVRRQVRRLARVMTTSRADLYRSSASSLNSSLSIITTPEVCVYSV